MTRTTGTVCLSSVGSDLSWVFGAPPKNAAALALSLYFEYIEAAERTAGVGGGFACCGGTGSVLEMRLGGMWMPLSASAACTDGAGLLSTLFDNFGLRYASGCRHRSSVVGN